MVNNKCPYCGSDDIVADIDIRITGKLDENGEIHAWDFWHGEALDNEAIAQTSSEDIRGFCPHCGLYSDFDWQQGFFINEEYQDDNQRDAYYSVRRTLNLAVGDSNAAKDKKLAILQSLKNGARFPNLDAQNVENAFEQLGEDIKGGRL